nr:ABC transporter family substrate-binding protein [Actinomycetota bacterium]
SENLAALTWLTVQVYPSVFEVLPDFSIELNEEMMESAELTSEDPQTIEYVIKEEAVWSDGTPISADDLIYLWENQNGSNPNIDVASTTGYELIESVEGSEDGKTVTAVFTEPFSDWQSLFGTLLPAHYMKTLNPDPVEAWNNGLDGTNLPEVSGGAWMLTDYTPEQSVTLVPNETYYGEKAKLDSVVARFGITADAIPQALENGEIDIAYPQPQIDLVSQVEALAPEIEATTEFGLTFEHIDFNLDNTFLADEAVRTAIAHGLDRQGIVERTVGQFSDEASQLDNRIWLTNQPQYEPHGEEYAEQDVEAAKAVLEEAGYTEGAGGIYEKDGQPISLRISTTGGNALREATEQVIQSQLKEVGIDIRIDNTEGAAVFDRFFPESDNRADLDFDIALFAWVGTPFPSSSASLYQTPDPADKVGQNEMGYANAEVDELFTTAAVSTDQDEVADLLNQVDEILWEDLPTIPLYQKPTYLTFRSNIQGVQDNPGTAGPLWNANEWALAAG